MSGVNSPVENLHAHIRSLLLRVCDTIRLAPIHFWWMGHLRVVATVEKVVWGLLHCRARGSILASNTWGNSPIIGIYHHRQTFRLTTMETLNLCVIIPLWEGFMGDFASQSSSSADIVSCIDVSMSTYTPNMDEFQIILPFEMIIKQWWPS